MKHISRSITGLMLRRKSQQGAALLISLILLLVLTFLGITSMQTTTLEERMTANQKDYYLAFEAAEYALDFAEAELAVLFSTGDFDVDGPNGLYQGHLTDSEHVWKTVNWSDETKVKVLDDYLDFGITSEAPKFIVEVMQIVESGLDTHNIGNEYGEQTGATKTTIFRVTARGASGKGSVVFLQSTFGKAI